MAETSSAISAETKSENQKIHKQISYKEKELENLLSRYLKYVSLLFLGLCVALVVGSDIMRGRNLK